MDVDEQNLPPGAMKYWRVVGGDAITGQVQWHPPTEGIVITEKEALRREEAALARRQAEASQAAARADSSAAAAMEVDAPQEAARTEGPAAAAEAPAPEERAAGGVLGPASRSPSSL